ncbi:MAG: hypothetical protein H6710_07400 [Myxococcales bacterium]|nr:hypothetical protein [Myxococcales bacterium]
MVVGFVVSVATAVVDDVGVLVSVSAAVVVPLVDEVVIVVLVVDTPVVLVLVPSVSLSVPAVSLVAVSSLVQALSRNPRQSRVENLLRVIV